MNRLGAWAYVILCFLIGTLAIIGARHAIETQNQHQRSLTDDLAEKYPQ